MLKIVISILFLIVFGFYSFGNILLFNFVRQEIRSEIKNVIRINDSTRIEILTISKTDLNNPSIFKKEETDEFIYSNKLYDIVRSDSSRDSVIFYCINDIKEERLIKQFLKESIEDILKSNFNDRFPKFNSLKLIFLDKIANIEVKFVNSYKIINHFDLPENIKFFYSKIPTPPPRYC